MSLHEMRKISECYDEGLMPNDFDISFISSLERQSYDLTARQERAIDNIYRKYKIEILYEKVIVRYGFDDFV